MSNAYLDWRQDVYEDAIRALQIIASLDATTEEIQEIAEDFLSTYGMGED